MSIYTRETCFDAINDIKVKDIIEYLKKHESNICTVTVIENCLMEDE